VGCGLAGRGGGGGSVYGRTRTLFFLLDLFSLDVFVLVSAMGIATGGSNPVRQSRALRAMRFRHAVVAWWSRIGHTLCSFSFSLRPLLPSTRHGGAWDLNLVRASLSEGMREHSLTSIGRSKTSNDTAQRWAKCIQSVNRRWLLVFGDSNYASRNELRTWRRWWLASLNSRVPPHGVEHRIVLRIAF
jgi:hypothetical protein